MIDSTALTAWKDGQLTNAEVILSAARPMAENPGHHVLASRALVRARLGKCNAALVDAKEVRVTLLSHTWTLTRIKPSPSKFGHPSLATLQSVSLLLAKGRHTQDIWCATLHFNTSTRIISFSPRWAFHQWNSVPFSFIFV